MFRHAAMALCIAVLIGVAASSTSAGEIDHQTVESAALTDAGDPQGDADRLSDFEDRRAIPELSAELILGIALLVTSVASIPGRVR